MTDDYIICFTCKDEFKQRYIHMIENNLPMCPSCAIEYYNLQIMESTKQIKLIISKQDQYIHYLTKLTKEPN